MTWKANTLTALILFLLIGSGTALSQFPPFQFLQKARALSRGPEGGESIRSLAKVSGYTRSSRSTCTAR
jgi:hypothetical protein